MSRVAIKNTNKPFNFTFKILGIIIKLPVDNTG
jgi:hypothetical protein